MSWITVDTRLGKHPKMAALPSDTARYGWVLVLLEAKEQRKPGTFASANHFRLVMDRHGKFLKDYIAAKLLDENEDGSLHVHDWRRHQWSAAKAQQRETSEGHGEDKDEKSQGLKEDASRAVPVSVSSSNGEGVQGEPDAAVAFRDRTGEFPGPKILRWLNELGEAHGERRLTDMIARTPQSGTVVDYLRTVRDNLRAEDHAAERAEKADEERRVAEKRAALKPLPRAADISEEEAKRQAAAYMAEAKR